MCVDDVSESGDPGHWTLPPDSCGTDGESRESAGPVSACAGGGVRVHHDALPESLVVIYCVRGPGKAHPHHKSGDEECDFSCTLKPSNFKPSKPEA